MIFFKKSELKKPEEVEKIGEKNCPKCKIPLEVKYDWPLTTTYICPKCSYILVEAKSSFKTEKIEKPVEKIEVKPPKLEKVKHEIPKELEEGRRIRASDVMTRNVITVDSNDRLCDVVNIFTSENISGVPVLSNNKFVGLLTESDILRAAGVRKLLEIDTIGIKRLGDMRVEEIMNKYPININENATLSETVNLMNRHEIHRLPVLNEKNQLVGIVTRMDVIREISKELPELPLVAVKEKRGVKLEKVETKRRVETTIDKLLEILDEKSMSIEELEKKLDVPEKQIEKWGKILEEYGLIEVIYPPIGKPILRKKAIK